MGWRAGLPAKDPMTSAGQAEWSQGAGGHLGYRMDPSLLHPLPEWAAGSSTQPGANVSPRQIPALTGTQVWRLQRLCQFAFCKLEGIVLMRKVITLVRGV